MKKRSRAGGRPAKGRRQKAPEPKRGNAPKPAPRSNSAPEVTEVARLTRELGEAVEQQTATSEVLNAISRSTFDLPTVLSTLVETAARLCRADKVQILLPSENSNRVYSAASFGYSGEYNEYLKTITFAPGREGVAGRVLLERKPVQIADVLADSEYGLPKVQRLGGFRTHLGLPLLREDSVIGVLLVSRTVVEPFDDKHIELLGTFAAQAVIAIENARLLNELRQRTTDLTERTGDLTEALEQQTATSEVLQAISSSSGDLEPVFATMLQNAVRICDAKFGNIYRWDGEVLHLLASHNTPPAFAAARKRSPLRPPPETPVGRMLAHKAAFHLADMAAHPGYIDRSDPGSVAAVELGGVRTILAIPMLKENELIGSFSVYRQEVRPFTDKQIALVTSFAAQAVIAIENARLLSELRQRTDDLTERTSNLSKALEQQTATSEVLQVISSTPGDLQPVFATMLENAVRICDATFGNIYRWDGEALHMLASHNTPPVFAEDRRRSPYRPYPNSPIGRMVANKTLVHISDVRTEDVYTKQLDPVAVTAVTLGGLRTLLGVPLLNKSEMIGAFFLSRQEVRPFTDKQIELVKNFAAQAVIAIENARLLNELRGALERQTATSEVLQVISGSPGDLAPVFAAMLESAVRTCGAKFGNIYRVEGGGLSNVATHNTPTAFAEALRGSPYFSPGPNNPVRHMMQTKTIVHVPDVAASEAYAEREPITVASVELGQTRTLMIVPMLKDNKLVGAFTLARQEVRPFTDKQIELVQNFAAQAVIAIENTRLLNELRQSLEQQTATSEVLQVISSSPGALQPVFDAMLTNATRLCEASFGILLRYENAAFHVAASHNAPPAFVELRRREPTIRASGVLRRVVATKQLLHISDCLEDASYKQGDADFVRFVDLCGARSFIAAPMLKDDELVGTITVFHQVVRPFNDKQIELVTNFAAQAVIAIENARLLNELRQSLEQQTASSDVLKIISTSQGDLQPVFEAMVDNATRICQASLGTLTLYENGGFRHVALHRAPAAYRDLRAREPFVKPHPAQALGRLASTKKVVHVTDVMAEPEPARGELFRLAGARTLLIVPMLKDEELLGAIGIYRQEVRPFSEEQINLLKNFADQAVIAIENARLLNELRQRTDDLSQRTTDLSKALEEQTATSEVLQVISGSPSDPQPVFEAMLEKAVRVCDATFGGIYRYEGGANHLIATHNTPVAFLEALKQSPSNRPTSSISARLVATKSAVQVVDLAAGEDYVERRSRSIVAAVELGGTRTVLAVPMLKENEVVGVLWLNRREVRPFTDKQIALVTNFATQAVIAIENARLLNDLRDRTQEVVKLNQQLEQRVADQVGEIERMSRLRRFLPPQVADLIVASGTEKQLESHRREITALFCDLRGFTGFSESADPEDVMTLLREYHEALGASIIKYSGTLERYAGDGVMVVFNDPVPVENPALQAVLMALEMRKAIGALTETWHRWGHDIGFGIGIAHGFATLGTIGFEGRFDYAAIGTVSNVASRLCDEAKPGQILISPRVLTKVENAVKVEPVGEFALKGIRRPLAAYNVLAAVSQEN